jgi:hypothetical protein
MEILFMSYHMRTKINSFLVGFFLFLSAAVLAAGITDFSHGGTSSAFTKQFMSATNPYISSGFGYTASAVLANANGTAAFKIPVSGVTATSGVIALPTASNGWSCNTFNEVHSASSVAVVQTASAASSVTLINYNASQAEGAFPASSVIHGSCFAY